MTDQEKKQEIEDFDLSNHIYENYLYSGKEADAVADLLKQNTEIAYEFCSSEEDDLYLMENEPYICASFSAQKIVDDTGCSRVAAYAMMARMAQYPEEQPSILKAIQDLTALHTNGILYGDTVKRFWGYKGPYLTTSSPNHMVYGVNGMYCWDIEITCPNSGWAIQNYHFTSEKDLLAFLLRLPNIQADKPTPWYKPTNIFTTHALPKQPTLKLFSNIDDLNQFLAEHRNDSVWITDICPEDHLEQIDLQGEFYRGVGMKKLSPDSILNSDTIFNVLFESYSLATDFFILYCNGNEEIASGIAKSFYDRFGISCDIDSWDEDVDRIMSQEIEKQLALLKDYINDIKRNGPRILWRKEGGTDVPMEDDYLCDENEAALSIAGLVNSHFELMDYIFKTVLSEGKTAGLSASLGGKLLAMDQNGILYGGRLKKYVGLTLNDFVTESNPDSVCFCYDDKWRFLILDSEGHPLEDLYYSSYEELLNAVAASTGDVHGSDPVEWLYPTHTWLTNPDPKPIQVKWMQTLTEQNRFFSEHPGNAVFEVTLWDNYEHDCPHINKYYPHGATISFIPKWEHEFNLSRTFLNACFHSAEYFVIYSRHEKVDAAKTAKALSELLGVKMDISIYDDNEYDDDNTFTAIHTEFKTMSSHLDIYQQWGTGVSLRDLSEKYQVNEAAITNTIKLCKAFYLEPIFGEFMLEEGSDKRIAEMIQKYVPKFTF